MTNPIDRAAFTHPVPSVSSDVVLSVGRLLALAHKHLLDFPNRPPAADDALAILGMLTSVIDEGNDLQIEALERTARAARGETP